MFGSCIIHILYTGCAGIKKINSGAKRLFIRCTLMECVVGALVTDIETININPECHAS